MAQRVHASARSGLAFFHLLTTFSLYLHSFQQSYALSPAQLGGWVEIQIPSIDGFKISFADSLHGWIIGSSGAILYSSDVGATWQPRQCPVQIGDAELVSSHVGWVKRSPPVWGDTVLYKTTDAGQSWSLTRLPRPLTIFQSVSFISDSVVYVAVDSSGQSTALWATTDGGESWNQRAYLNGLAGVNMDFFDSVIGYAGNVLAGQGIPSILRKTSDGGFNWTSAGGSQYDPGQFFYFRFIDGKLGSYWSGIYPEIGPSSVSLNLTWNCGETWTRIASYQTSPYLTGMARDSTHRWIVRTSGSIRRTTNDGATWHEDTLAVPISEILYDLYGHQFALGGGRLFRYDSTLTDVADSRFVPEESALFQNYPNPFNPSTAISYQLTANSFVTLRVFDVLGREVAPLVNELKAPGTHEVMFDGSSLPSGVYFYKLQSVSGSITKRMILMK